MQMQQVEETTRAGAGGAVAKKMAAAKTFPRVAMDLATTVERVQQNFVISDPSIPDCPIVFASDSFCEMTGYDRYEILGRNCRFLQVRKMEKSPLFPPLRGESFIFDCSYIAPFIFIVIAFRDITFKRA